MTYKTVADMVDSVSLMRREFAAIAKEGIDPPDGWHQAHRWKLASSPGWDAAWDSALAGHPDDPDYDPGDDNGVITDGMILSAVQHLIEFDRPPVVVTTGSTQTIPSTDPKAVADPQTAWPVEQYATFTDGNFRWDGSGWVAFTPAPTVTVLEPSSASIADADFEGHIRGTGFTEDSVIIWNGAEEPTRFIDSTNIWTTVVPSVVTAPTVLDVYVRNGDGQVSGILPFTWTAAPEPLAITALEPSSASITDANFEGHIRGTGFTEGTVIIWNGAEEPTRFVDSTDVWTMVVPSVVTAPTVLDVYVRDGEVASGILQFTWTE